MYDMIGKNVMIKPHQGHKELIVPFLPPDRVVWDRAETLIKKYQKIYCFSDSSITKDCEMLGKQYEIVDKEEIRR
jgi:hypothetical protein